MTGNQHTHTASERGIRFDFADPALADGVRIGLTRVENLLRSVVQSDLEFVTETALHLVDAGGKLPVIIVFVDTDAHVSRVLPKLKEMAAHRLIVRENVVLEQGSLD